MKSVLVTILFLLAPLMAHADGVHEEMSYIKAEVVEILSSETRPIPALGLTEKRQTLLVRLLEGASGGKTVTIENDYLELAVGDRFYAMQYKGERGLADVYAIGEPDRAPPLYVLFGIFIITLLIFGGMQGIRGLLSLVSGLFLITGILLPGILKGYSPILLALVVAGLIVTVGSYITHGFRRTTSAAIMAMLAVIVISGLLALWVTHAAKLTGFSDEATTYLNINTGGIIDFQGLLLGSILIGLLGVLYDIAIGQTVTVEELLRANAKLPRRQIYRQALRIGREHIGALINTLAIAYVGASLPLFLLFYSSDHPLIISMNHEVFATEIARMLIGSIGLLLATPIATLAAIFLLTQQSISGAPSTHHHKHH